MSKVSIVNAEINNRLKGYSKNPKIFIMLWINNHLSSSAFCFYLYLINIATFDDKEVKSIHHGLVKYTKTQVSRSLNYNSKTVTSWFKELEDIGAIHYSDEGYIFVTNYDEVIHQAGTTFHKNRNQQDLIEKYFHLDTKKVPKPRKNISYKRKKSSIKTMDKSCINSNYTYSTINSYKGNIDSSVTSKVPKGEYVDPDLIPF